MITCTDSKHPGELIAYFDGKFIGRFVLSNNGEYYYDPFYDQGYFSASDLLMIANKLQELNLNQPKPMKTILFDRLTPEALEKFNSLPEENQLKIREILDKYISWSDFSLFDAIWLAFYYQLTGFNTLPFTRLFEEAKIQDQ